MHKSENKLGSPAEPRKQITTVVADDSPAFLKAVCEGLRDQGCIEIVAAVTNGVEAVEQTALRHPQLVVLDVHMPEMSGPVAAAIVRANHPQTRVVLMSIEDHAEIQAWCRASGADAFIAKSSFLCDFPLLLAQWFPEADCRSSHTREPVKPPERPDSDGPAAPPTGLLQRTFA
jgi:CheY-like chemotaxis protein